MPTRGHRCFTCCGARSLRAAARRGRDPQRASLHSNLGYALQQAGRVDQALAEYREALQLDPKLVSGSINLATALAMDPSKRSDARAALEKARALSPDNPRVKANLEELDGLTSGPRAPKP